MKLTILLILNLYDMSEEKVKCRNCENMHYCEKHHILPKKLFGDDETDFLCPTCHSDFHRLLGYKYLCKKNKQSMEFYLYKYYKWLGGLTIVAAILFFILE